MKRQGVTLTMSGVAWRVGFVALVGVVGASLAGFAGRSWWVFDLFSHFRAQYAVVLVAGALLMLWLGKRRVALLSAGGLLLNVAVIAPSVVPVSAPVVSSGSIPCRLASINVNSANRRYDLVEDWVRATQLDVVVLQEVTSRWMAGLAGLDSLYPHRVMQIEDGNFGIALLSRYPLEDAEVLQLDDVWPPSVSARVRLSGGVGLRVIGLHVTPPSSRRSSALRNRQLSALAQLTRSASGPAVVLGDLNLSPWSPHYGALLRESGLRDTARGQGVRPTWPVGYWWLWIPIDHAWVSDGMAVVRRDVGTDVGSDHYPLMVEVAVAGD
jgi:endonuclease/exonuclease/phosphatase (EEP) superfamily protein YafD